MPAERPERKGSDSTQPPPEGDGQETLRTWLLLFGGLALIQLSPWALGQALALQPAVWVTLGLVLAGLVAHQVVRRGLPLPTSGDRRRAKTASSAEAEALENRIHHLAYHDTLTGLPNRTLFTDRVSRALVRARRSAKPGALLFLDLDKFKRINDSLGHSVGDLLLQEVAQRLRATLREADTVSRLGGDEFVVLLEALGNQDEHTIEQAAEVAEKLRQMFTRAYMLEGHELLCDSEHRHRDISA